MTTMTIASRCRRCGGKSYRDQDIYGDVLRCINCGRVVEDLNPPKREEGYQPKLTPTEALVYAKAIEYGQPVTSTKMGQLAGKGQTHAAQMLRSLTSKGLLAVSTKTEDGRRVFEWRLP